ncbi:ATP-binding protein [Halobacillus sp. A5]|uniref:sensor histidine kinase n=1 Tax=Halobacillus sp. A5 TaxID=2880263 RepID=UPI0020A6AB6C|nr:ATP-binding protein [Halobacillus sp. A5]MCP3025367.1 HAMP domain-containing protein [Halobacillus sp. A5]
MTIKLRLFLSNALIIIILLIAFQFEELIEKDDLELILNDIEQMDILDKSEAIAFAIYKDENILYDIGGFQENELFDIASDQESRHHFTKDNMALYSVNSGDYRLYLSYEYGDEENKIEGYTPPFPWDIVIMILILFVAIWLLHRMVFKSIVIPLDILVDGVREIRDGNLNYRLRYNRKDEFLNVCEDFNEMAGQLQRLIEAKKKDDENRRELIAGISHDLRTPLTSIKAYVEGLEKGVASNPEMKKEYLRTITKKTDDLNHVVNQLFLFSKLDTGDFPLSIETLDIGKLLKVYEQNIKTEYNERGLETTFLNFAENVFVKVDSVQIRNVFTNIIENSLKYGNQSHNSLTIECIPRGEEVKITFQDNGPGVPEDKLKNLFNAFYRTDAARRNPGQGSGLGLAISHKIIERCGGTISAKSPSNSGLIITIALPIVGGKNETDSYN